MRTGRGDRIHLDAVARARLAGWLSDPVFELIPLASAWGQIEHLPARARVSITASPSLGLPATVRLSADLAAAGFRPIPHLSARMIAGRAELAEIMEELKPLDVAGVFVIGGDADQIGEFPDALSLLQAMEELGHPFREIGIGCYPEGHAFIPTAALLDALEAKSAYATSMTSQVCFDPAAISAWLADRRRQGIDLPINIGIPGATRLRRLIQLSARIGVGQSMRFLSKNTALIGRLGHPSGYTPDALIAGLAAIFADPSCRVGGFHIFTFNQVEETARWRSAYLERLEMSANG